MLYYADETSTIRTILIVSTIINCYRYTKLASYRDKKRNTIWFRIIETKGHLLQKLPIRIVQPWLIWISDRTTIDSCGIRCSAWRTQVNGDLLRCRPIMACSRNHPTNDEFIPFSLRSLSIERVASVMHVIFIYLFIFSRKIFVTAISKRLLQRRRRFGLELLADKSIIDVDALFV